MLGKHNVLNAAGSAIIAMNEGIKMTSIKRALLNFPGVARRFERYELSLPNRDLLSSMIMVIILKKLEVHMYLHYLSLIAVK